VKSDVPDVPDVPVSERCFISMPYSGTSELESGTNVIAY
jgi:hypothetical protein